MTLAWNGEDVAQRDGLAVREGRRREVHRPAALELLDVADDKLLHDGKIVGVSTFSGYSYNERSMLSLGSSTSTSPIGTEVTLVWGEEGGGSAKPVVERHKQAEIRAVVSPVPVLGGRTHVVRRGLADEGRRQLATSSSAATSSSVAERYGAWSASSSNTRSHGCSRIIRRWSAGAMRRSCSVSTY